MAFLLKGLGGLFGGLVEGVAEGWTRDKLERARDKKGDPPADPVRGVGKGIGMAAGKQLREIEVAERESLYNDLRKMDWPQKKNVIGRLKDKLKSCDENEFVRLLSKLPKENDSRVKELTFLNAGLPETDVTLAEEPEILLELLNDNGKRQLAEKGLSFVRRTSRKVSQEWTPNAVKATKAKLGPAGDGLAKPVGGIADWLEKHGGKK